MNEKTVAVRESRILHFPVMMFAIVMGFSGLTLVYQKAASWMDYPHIIASSLAGIDTLIFLIIASIYLAKVALYKDEVKKEISHPVRINFFAAISISLLLLSSIYHEINHTIATYLFYLGASLQTFFTFYTISFWINRNMEVQHSNPAWFIPIVGNVIAPIGGSGIVNYEVLMYFFSVGIFFWIVFLTIIMNRIIFHHQLAQKFIPTFFIFIAPPAVGMVSYIKMTDSFDLFASFLYNIALFFTFLLIFMGKNFLKLKFFISWWAFTFPLAAVSIASLLAYKKTGLLFYGTISNILIILTTVVVAIVAFQTIKHMFKKEICIAE